MLYNIGINLYALGIRIAASRNAKARKMVSGWSEAWLKRKKGNEPTAWFHVASLGEFEQAKPVITLFREHHPEYSIWLTFFSPSGYEASTKYSEAEYITYLPIDTRRNAKKLIELINPQVAFFVKYDFWYNYMRQLRQRAVPTYIFSTIFRPNHYFFKPYGKWFLHQLGCFTHIFVQNEQSMQLLAAHGFSNISKSGDTRFDRVKTIALQAPTNAVVEEFLGFGRNKLEDKKTSENNTNGDTSNNGSTCECLIGGSTWEPDEANLYRYLCHRGDRIKYILAPHVISESHIAAIVEQFGADRCIRYSQFHNQPQPRNAQVLIIDNIGMLSTLYRYGTIAYIGGGFGRGIHNILEALTYNKPVIFGPNNKKFQEAQDIKHLGGGWEYTNYDQLEQQLDLLLNSDTELKRAAEVCRNYVDSNIGCSAKIMATVDLNPPFGT